MKYNSDEYYMSQTFNANSFGADLPEDWREICDKLNQYHEDHPEEDPNDIWEAYWNNELED